MPNTYTVYAVATSDTPSAKDQIKLLSVSLSPSHHHAGACSQASVLPSTYRHKTPPEVASPAGTVAIPLPIESTAT